MKEKLLQNKEAVITGIVGIILGIALCLIVIVVGGASSMRLNGQNTLEATEPTTEEPTTEEPTEETTEETTEEPTTEPPTEPPLTEDEVIQLLMPAERLLVSDYLFSDVEEYENAAKIFDIEVYKDKTVLIYSGSVRAGISLSEMLCEVNPQTMTITIALPEAEVLSSTIATTGSDLENYAKVVAELENKKFNEYSENDEFLSHVTDCAEKVLEQLLATSERTKDYYVKFEV